MGFSPCCVFSAVRRRCRRHPAVTWGEFQHDLAFHPRRLAPAVFRRRARRRVVGRRRQRCRTTLRPAGAAAGRLAVAPGAAGAGPGAVRRVAPAGPARSGAERQLRGARGAGAVAGRFRAGAGGGGRRLRGAPAPGRRLQRQRAATGRADHRRQRSRSGRQQRRPFDPDPAGYRTTAGGQHPQPAADPARSDHGRLAQAGRTDHQHLGPGRRRGRALYPGRRAEERLRALPAGHRVHRTGNDQAHRGGEGTALGVHRQWRLRRHRAHGDQGRAGPAARRPRRRRHAQVRLSLQRPAEDLLRRRVRSQRRPPRRCPALSQRSRRPRHEAGRQPAAVAHRLPDQPQAPAQQRPGREDRPVQAQPAPHRGARPGFHLPALEKLALDAVLRQQLPDPAEPVDHRPLRLRAGPDPPPTAIPPTPPGPASTTTIRWTTPGSTCN